MTLFLLNTLYNSYILCDSILIIPHVVCAYVSLCNRVIMTQHGMIGSLQTGLLANTLRTLHHSGPKVLR